MSNYNLKSEFTGAEIAIVGMAGRFPGANDLETFWRNLRDGVESVTFFSDEQLRSSGVHPALLRDPAYVRAAAVLDGIELFDASFFGFTPREAEILDPQHRLFLECAWEALEKAGYDCETYPGGIGVYAGAGVNTYVSNLESNHDILEAVNPYQIRLANRIDNLSTRVSYKLNLKGPSITVQTTCSTSLVAVHLACQSLLNFDCDLALAGGVKVVARQNQGYVYQEGMIFSPDGHCRTFDASSGGIIRGSGVGIVVLKRLTDAIADADSIYAIIRGSAINNDGSAKVGYTAPSVDGQANVIKAAQTLAEVAPDTISYIEAHGTATELGDPIEIAALTKAFRAGTKKKHFCAIGSVKTNFGHLDTAAGVAGLIKTVLALENRMIPPSLHFEKPNPKIDFENSPFYVNSKLAAWPETDHPRRAGVSSFGIGGTNAHVILEEAPLSAPSDPSRSEQLLLLSAKTEAALDQATKNLRTYLEEHPDANLADVAFTLQRGRRRFIHRRALVCHGAKDAAASLGASDSKRMITVRNERQDASVAFMFPGQGAQYVNMGLGLYESEPVFRKSVDGCAEVLSRHLGLDVRTILYPSPSQVPEAERKITETFVTQPALFVIEYASAQLWMHWGIEPKALIGHSLGEYVAACLAGVMSCDDALLLVAERARLMQQLPGGAMLAVRLPSDQVHPFLGEQLSIAAINAAAATVVSGPYADVERLEARLTEQGIAFRRLATSHAFHSGMLEPILDRFESVVKTVSLQPPRMPWASCLTGDWMTAAEVTESRYWVNQLRSPVNFTAALQKVIEQSSPMLLEMGPGRALCGYVKQHPGRPAKQTALSSFHQEKDSTEIASMLHSLGQLWLAGARVDWPHVHGGQRRRRIALPTYPFERKAYWISAPFAHDPSKSMAARSEAKPQSSGGLLTESGEKTMSEPVVSPPIASRKTEVLSGVQALFAELSGMELSKLDTSANFMELGFDSLFLTQASTAINHTFHVNVPFRQLIENFSTIDALADYLNETMPQEKLEQRTAVVTPIKRDQVPSSDPTVAQVSFGSLDLREGAKIPPSSGTVEQIIKRQLELMALQIDLLRHDSLASQGQRSLEEAPPPNNGSQSHPIAVLSPSQNGQIHGATANGAPHLPLATVEPTTFGPYVIPKKEVHRELTAEQQKHLDTLIARYVERTKESKRYTQTHRVHLADPRVVAGFRSVWKELTYPIVVARSSGCKLWDIDGNEYIDLTNGFGSSLFGYAPPFITEAIETQLRTGIEIGPQSVLSGEVAELISELTGMERVAFCNTGSESVMAALRVARTITGRNKIAMFSGSYHGNFDEVLVRPGGTEALARPRPIAPGIVPSMVENVLVLDYGSPASLEALKRHAHELAAVLVEPVQSRRPDLQPREFLRSMREITADAGTALIMDEMITGFRCHPGGVQELFGVKGDLATYGKVVGGGLPIGVLAGRAKFMDALDGGMWSFGDRSAPEVGMTFFAGTFVRHPLALAAAKAVLKHLKQNGSNLQIRLNATTADLVSTLRARAEKLGAPIRLSHFSSWFCINFPGDWPLASLFFTYMRQKGVHLLEGRPCFLTTAHTDADLRHVVRAFEESIVEMQEARFLSVPKPVVLTRETKQDELRDPLSFELTDAQREVWFAAQMGEEVSRGFVHSFHLHLRGSLRTTELRNAIQESVRRHDALRTTFAESGEEQRVAPDMIIDIPLTDLSALEESKRGKRFAELTVAESEIPFDLSRGPLLRTRLLKLNERHHVLLLTTHHIAVDGWSSGVLLSELAAIYSAECRGKAHNLTMPAQYADYVRWQASPLQIANRDLSETFWLKQFEVPAPVLALPTDRPRPVVQTYSGARERMILPPSLCDGLRRMAAQRGCTLFAALLAAFDVLLHRLTGQEDVVIAVPAAGQGPFGARDLVGHCINFLPLRIRMDAQATFSEHLRSIRRIVLDAHDHQYCTYGRLLQKLKIPRDTSRLPLMSVSFNVDRSVGKLDFDGLDVEISGQANTAINLDIRVNLVETDSDIKVDWDYNTDLFDAETIVRWLDHYRTLLESILADPDQRLSELSILSKIERQELLVEWNATQAVCPQRCFQELFEAQVERTPDAVAVMFGGQLLTYRELNARANRLAHHLRRLGVEPGGLVGVCVERSLEMVIGLLGILKAGGAYVPLDPAYPTERLGFVLEDAQPKVVLTQESLTAALPTERSRMICLDSEWRLIGRESEGNLGAEITGNDTAYVIYTSGSTGKPKGVEITHGALVNFLKSMGQQPGMTDSDVLLAVTTISFDIAGLELYLPLTMGARVVIAEREISADGRRLSQYITQVGATVMQATPATWRMLIGAGWRGSPGLKILCGGEALPGELATQLLARGVSLWNLYGPTETTIWSTLHRVESIGGSVPIGRPIANTEIYILDRNLEPVPIGVAGELYIGGAGLARGYLNRPELTEEKFIRHPFSHDSTARLYKTGDLARYLTDGNIEYLGRLDDQVKVRGFRIELGEVESALSQHPAVTENVVVVREDEPGDKRLVGYVVSQGKPLPSVGDLRGFLSSKLPDYMVPSAFVELNALPLTPNGKVDRKALPPPDHAISSHNGAFVAPRTPTEKTIAEICAQVLRVETVGMQDDFFESGGHSLLAMKVIYRIRDVFQLDLPVRVLFERPTIEELALTVEEAIIDELESQAKDEARRAGSSTASLDVRDL
jgi:amino acid adenylation domain-containing protein